MSNIELRFLVSVTDDSGDERYLAYSHKAGQRAPVPTLRNDETAVYPMTMKETVEAAEYAVRFLKAKNVNIERIEPKQQQSNGNPEEN